MSNTFENQVTSKNKLYLDNFLMYLIALVPLGLLTGPFLPDLLISISTIIILFILFSNNEKKYIFNSFTLIFLIFYFYLLLSSLISNDPLFSLRSTLFYFRFGAFSIAVWYLLDKKEEFLKIFLFFLIIAFCLSIFSGFYQFLNNQTLFGEDLNSNRLVLLVSNNATLGNWISRLFPLLIGLLILYFKPSYIYYICIFILFISVDFLVYISGERTALGLLFLSSIFILLLIKKLKYFRLITLSVSVFLIVLVTMFNSDVRERNIDHTIKQLGIGNSNNVNIFSPVHEDYLKASWKMFLENKSVGVGANNYRNYCHLYIFSEITEPLSCSTHPHNSYMQVLAEIGILGFVFLLIPGFLIVYACFKQIYSIFLGNGNTFLSDFQICLIACFLCSLWPIIPTMNFFNNWINIIYYLPVGFLLHTVYVKSNV